MCNSSRPNVTARSRPALMHQIAGTQDICRGLESEELVLENFHQGSSLLLSRQGRGRAGSLGQPHSPLPPSLHGDARWGIRWRHNHTDTHAQILSHFFSLSRFSILGSDARNNPVSPPEPVAKPQPKRTNSLSSLPEAKTDNIVLQHLASAAF